MTIRFRLLNCRTLSIAGLALLLLFIQGVTSAGLDEPGPAPKPEPPGPAPAIAKHARADEPLPPGAIARLGSLRLRHAASVRSILFATDGKTLTSAGDLDFRFNDHSVRLWDAATGQQLHVWDARAMDIAFTGKTLAVAHDHSHYPDFRRRVNYPGLSVWEVSEPKKKKDLWQRKRGSVTSAALNRDNALLAAADDEGAVRLFNLTTGEEKALDLPRDVSYRVLFSADGKTLVLSTHWRHDDADAKPRGEVFVWDVALGKLRTRFVVREDYFAGDLALSPDGATLAVVTSEASTWDLATGRKLKDYAAGLDVRCVAFSANGKALALGCYEPSKKEGEMGFVTLVDVATGKETRRLPGYANPVAFSPDGIHLATAGDDHTIRLFNAETGRQVLPSHGSGNAVSCLALSRDGKTVVAGCQGGWVFLWDVATGKESLRRRLQLGFCNYADYGVVTIADDGKALASAHQHPGWEKETPTGPAVWDINTGEVVLSVAGTKAGADGGRYVCPVGLSSDGRLAVSVGEADDILIHEIGPVRVRHRLRGHEGGISHVSFAADNRTVVSRANGERAVLRLWDAVSGRLLGRFEGSDHSGWFAVSRDGRWLAWWKSGNQLSLVEIASGEEVGVLGVPMHEVHTLAFSPDGKMLALGCEAAGISAVAIHLWDVAAGKKLAILEGHAGPVRCLAFARDGKTLLSGSDDTTILVWDLSPRLPKSAPPREVAEEELKELWADLAAPVARRAVDAAPRLIAAGNQSVAFLKDHLPPAPAVDEKRVARLIADLDHERFADRQHATEELRKYGELIELPLRKRLREKIALETHRRLEQLLAHLDSRPPEQLRKLRAIAVLEHVGTKEARECLEVIARGNASAQQTQAAQAALERMR